MKEKYVCYVINHLFKKTKKNLCGLSPGAPDLLDWTDLLRPVVVHLCYRDSISVVRTLTYLLLMWSQSQMQQKMKNMMCAKIFNTERK